MVICSNLSKLESLPLHYAINTCMQWVMWLMLRGGLYILIKSLKCFALFATMPIEVGKSIIDCPKFCDMSYILYM